MAQTVKVNVARQGANVALESPEGQKMAIEELKRLVMYADEMRKNPEKQTNDKYKFEKLDVVNEGTSIVLPEGMTKEEGIHCLRKRIEQDEKPTAIHEVVDAYPLEGAYALMKVLMKVYGWASPVPKPGFFGDTPPTMLNLEIAHNVSTQIVWGQFEIPGIEGRLETGATQKDGRHVFCIRGQVKQKYKDDVARIAVAVRDFVKEFSIYKGKAIRIRTDEEGHLNTSDAPKFLDTTRTDPNMLIFSKSTLTQVQTHIFTPILRTQQCRELGIPLKRSVLLEGPFGTGKTLTAHVAAHMAERNGWTFIYLDRVSALKEALIFARQYSPAIIFAEDIDRVVGGERDAEVDDILNTIDGIDSKHDETMVILTTNDVNAIEKAMIRPGRLDAVIHVGPPDAKAAEQLIRVYAGNLLDTDEDLVEAGRELDGQIPATIAEVVKRSKLYAVSHTAPGATLRLTGLNIAESARGMKDHLALLADVKAEPSKEHQLGALMAEVVTKSIEDKVNNVIDTNDKITSIHDYCS
jgi:hypothetical protein